MFRELYYVANDLKELSEPEDVTVNSIRVLVTPNWQTLEMTIEYFFNCDIKDYYDFSVDIFKDLENVIVRHSSRHDIRLIELMKCNTNEIGEYFDCDDVTINYGNNHSIEYNEELSEELWEKLQSTYEAMYCAIHDY